MNPLINLYKGDSIEIMKDMPENSIDLILTDPPYAREYIYLYTELAKVAARILKPGKALVAYASNYYLSEIMQNMGKYLDWYWLVALRHGGNRTTMIMQRRIAVWYKPILIYTKGKPEMTPIMNDMIKGEGRSKEYHEWQQGTGELVPFIRKFSHRGDVILDPFMGSGTVGVATLRQDRNFIGIEIYHETFQMAQKRIDSSVKQEKLVFEETVELK